MNKIRWGVLGAAKIAREKVVPAMQAGRHCDMVAIASRSLDRAQKAADALGMPKAYGSYEALLDDPEIDAVYIPLPNHLHVEWTLKALQAGKHVLCEKPIGMSAREARTVLAAARENPRLKVMEAFMYRHHPSWQHVKSLLKDGAIGDLRYVVAAFSYFNVDPENIRNQPEIGGGGLLDIGCYCISASRFLFGRAPRGVAGDMKIHPDLGVDHITSGMLDFETGTAVFTCSTQSTGHQRVDAIGTNGKIQILIPFNIPADVPTRIRITISGEESEVIFDAADQYTIQGDLFSEAILNDRPVPTPIEDAVENMTVIDQIILSSETGQWVEAGSD